MIHHAQAFAVLGTVLAERRGGNTFGECVLTHHFILLPPKIFCGTACEFAMTGSTLHWGTQTLDSNSFWLVKISMAGHCLLKVKFQGWGKLKNYGEAMVSAF